MSKGDAGRTQGMINDVRNTREPFNQQINGQMWNGSMMGNTLASDANSRAFGDYDRLMGEYQKFASGEGAGAGGGGGAGLDPYYAGFLNKSLEGYDEFSKTGGFSPENIQDIRARAIAPTRAVYQNAQSNIDRQRALQGGYSPNYTAATAKLTRGMSDAASDANVNANASIAEMIQRGKLAGLGGEQQGAGMGLNAALQAASINSSAGSAARGQNLAALNAQQGMYEATPGLANMYGNQSIARDRNLLQAGNQYNDFGLGLTRAQTEKASVPSNFQQGMGNLGSVLSGIGNVAGMFGGNGFSFGGGGGGEITDSTGFGRGGSGFDPAGPGYGGPATGGQYIPTSPVGFPGGYQGPQPVPLPGTRSTQLFY